MSAPWRTTLATVAERLNAARIEWMLLGSAATALHGVAIIPGDIDIAIRTADDVSRAATVLPTPTARAEPPDWFSTTAEPTRQWGDTNERWTFGLWIIAGVKVELAHIDAPAVAELMVETRGPLVWHERQTLTCHDHAIPTVPLEVQLATMFARHQTTRLNAALATVHSTSLNAQLLRQAITDKQSELPNLPVPKSLQRLITQDQTATD